jgi:hypothetical protein
MKSPFPGMDPYLEARWPDVHLSLVGLIREALNPLLPPDLRARAEERVLLEEDPSAPRTAYRADVALIDLGRRAAESPAAAAAGSLAVATPEPIVIEYHDAPEVDRFVKIIDVKNGNRVVTAIEVLSPANKAPGYVNADYRRKVEDYTRSGVSVVEVDLLRSSRGRLRVSDVDLPADRRAAYMVCVQEGWRPGRWKAYPIGLRAPIPPVPVPLRRTDQPVLLELQPIIERAYAAGRHDDIDYSAPPDPRLGPEDEAWADALLRAAGRR